MRLPSRTALALAAIGTASLAPTPSRANTVTEAVYNLENSSLVSTISFTESRVATQLPSDLGDYFAVQPGHAQEIINLHNNRMRWQEVHSQANQPFDPHNHTSSERMDNFRRAQAQAFDQGINTHKARQGHYLRGDRFELGGSIAGAGIEVRIDENLRIDKVKGKIKLIGGTAEFSGGYLPASLSPSDINSMISVQEHTPEQVRKMYQELRSDQNPVTQALLSDWGERINPSLSDLQFIENNKSLTALQKEVNTLSKRLESASPEEVEQIKKELRGVVSEAEEHFKELTTEAILNIQKKSVSPLAGSPADIQQQLDTAEAYMEWGGVLSQGLGLFMPEEAQHLQNVVDFVGLCAMAYISSGDPVSVAHAASAGLNLIAGFTNKQEGPTFEQATLDALSKLQESINELRNEVATMREEMHERFDRIEKKLSSISEELYNIRNDLGDIHVTLQEILWVTDEIMDDIKTGNEKTLIGNRAALLVEQDNLYRPIERVETKIYRTRPRVDLEGLDDLVEAIRIDSNNMALVGSGFNLIGSPDSLTLVRETLGNPQRDTIPGYYETGTLQIFHVPREVHEGELEGYRSMRSISTRQYARNPEFMFRGTELILRGWEILEQNQQALSDQREQVEDLIETFETQEQLYQYFGHPVVIRQAISALHGAEEDLLTELTHYLEGKRLQQAVGLPSQFNLFAPLDQFQPSFGLSSNRIDAFQHDLDRGQSGRRELILTARFEISNLKTLEGMSSSIRVAAPAPKELRIEAPVFSTFNAPMAMVSAMNPSNDKEQEVFRPLKLVHDVWFAYVGKSGWDDSTTYNIHDHEGRVQNTPTGRRFTKLGSNQFNQRDNGELEGRQLKGDFTTTWVTSPIMRFTLAREGALEKMMYVNIVLPKDACIRIRKAELNGEYVKVDKGWDLIRGTQHNSEIDDHFPSTRLAHDTMRLWKAGRIEIEDTLFAAYDEVDARKDAENETLVRLKIESEEEKGNGRKNCKIIQAKALILTEDGNVSWHNLPGMIGKPSSHFQSIIINPNDNDGQFSREPYLKALDQAKAKAVPIVTAELSRENSPLADSTNRYQEVAELVNGALHFGTPTNGNQLLFELGSQRRELLRGLNTFSVGQGIQAFRQELLKGTQHDLSERNGEEIFKQAHKLFAKTSEEEKIRLNRRASQMEALRALTDGNEEFNLMFLPEPLEQQLERLRQISEALE